MDNIVDESKLKLVYVNKIGKNSSDLYEYEFFFSETPDVVWGQDWNIQSPASCGDLRPDPSTYHCVKRLKTIILFDVAQENTCFSLQDMCDNIIACAWNFDESIILHFGDSFSDVTKKIKNNFE